MPIRIDRVTMRRTSSRSNVAGDAGCENGGATAAPVGNGWRTTSPPVFTSGARVVVVVAPRDRKIVTLNRDPGKPDNQFDESQDSPR